MGDFLGSTGRNTSPVGPDIDNGTGTVDFGAFSYGEQAGADGSDVLATVSFSPQAVGESNLLLQNVQVLNTVPEKIPIETRDGHVAVLESHLRRPQLLPRALWEKLTMVWGSIVALSQQLGS